MTKNLKVSSFIRYLLFVHCGLNNKPTEEYLTQAMSENFSYSKMDTFVQCGFKYKLTYVDGHYIFAGSIATEFGTLIHATEEAIAKAIQASQPINYIQLKNSIILKMVELEQKYPNDFYTADKSGHNYSEKMYSYLESGIYRLEKYMQNHPTYEIVGIEQKFEVPYKDKYHFKGFIDRVFHDKATDNYIIQDIKTWAVPADKKDLAAPLQFVFYTLAARELYKCIDSQIFCQYDLPLCDLTQNAGDSNYMTVGVKHIDKYLLSIENKEFTPNPTPLCHWCNFCPTNPNQPAAGKNLCPYYCLWTKENKILDVAYPWQGPENHEQVLQIFNALQKNIV